MTIYLFEKAISCDMVSRRFIIFCFAGTRFNYWKRKRILWIVSYKIFSKKVLIIAFEDSKPIPENYGIIELKILGQ